LKFLPPWKIPSLLRAVTCVVIPERDFPIALHSPILPREVMAVGRCLILSSDLYRKRISPKIKDKENVLVVDPKDINAFSTTLRKVIQNPDLAEEIGERARAVSEEIENFDEYIEKTIFLYRDALIMKTA